MQGFKMNTVLWQILCGAAVVLGSLIAATVQAAAPGIVGSTAAGASSFSLSAAPTSITQPDGTVVYAWGYGCAAQPVGFKPTMAGQNCPSAQLPGPTLIV